MTISFVCPQGHPLTAHDSQAGQAGKCPHCGTRFLIPQLAVDDEGASDPPPAGVSPSMRASSRRTDSIVFTCPNGHKLNGPASLRGKLGLCPHCQTKFRIPADEPPPPAIGTASLRTSFNPLPPTGSSPITVSGSAMGAPADAAHGDEAPRAEILDEEDLEVVEGRPLEDSSDEVTEGTAEAFRPWSEPPPSVTESSRWCELFAWLWSQRDVRSAVELRLRGGEIFRPTWFSPSLSDRQIGVFGIAAENGGYGMSVLRWECVERIDVRGCEQIPMERFE